MYKFFPVFIFAIIVLISNGKEEIPKTSDIQAARLLPYPQSRTFSGLEWTGVPEWYPGTGSDMHWWTWGYDDNLYIIDDDGFNFDNPSSYSQLLVVSGTPPNHKIKLVNLFDTIGIKEGFNIEEDNSEKLLKTGYNRYLGGIAAVGSRLYVSVFDYNWKAEAVDKSMYDILSLSGGVAGFIYSDDNGVTWNNYQNLGDGNFLGPRFTALQFINFGPGYTGVPDYLRGYVYAISNDENWESGNNLFLARAPLHKILDKESWEFFAGFSPGNPLKKPTWIHDEKGSKPIFTDPGHTAHSSMSYNKPLDRYLLSVFSDTVPHTTQTPAKIAFSEWDVQTELQIYEGLTPWGPWRLIHNENPWGGKDHAPYLPQIPSKWLSNDGLSGWLLFSGDWIKHNRDWYGFMIQPFRLTKFSEESGK